MAKQEVKSTISRRDFIKAAGAGALALGALGAAGALASSCSSGSGISWDMTADVVVAGSGAGASAAATVAQSKGASVIMLEKSAGVGGTTMKSGGEIWIPNNFVLKAAGTVDDRTDCIQFMARANYSTIYNPAAAQFGLPDHEYNNLAAYYDNASVAVDYMMQIGAINYVAAGYAYDYWDHAVENKVPQGRGLGPVGGAGNALIAAFQAYIKANNINLLTSHRVTRIYLNNKNEVIGVQAQDNTTATPKNVNIRARKAVVFGCGGFTHNTELVRQFQKGPIFGGCAVITNEGDLVYMAEAIGAQLSNMNSAWNAQNILEDILKSPSSPNEIWQAPGDSMIQVNKYGVRVTDEKRSYNDRTKIHFYWDPVEQEFPNMVMMHIYDQRTADLYAGDYPFPAATDDQSIVISGQTIQELGTNIRARVASLQGQLGIFSIGDSFETNLAATITRFNGFATSGVDSDFKRGFYPYDTAWFSIFSPPQSGTKWPANNYPNITMYPFTAQGPYYCILVGGGTLDTNGGPKINEKAQILDTKENPIPGLYGAGNCIASLMPNYIAAGATIGNALTSGYLAGINSVLEPSR